MIPIIIAEELLAFREALAAISTGSKLVEGVGILSTTNTFKGLAVDQMSGADNAFFQTVGTLVGLDAAKLEKNPKLVDIFKIASDEAIASPLFSNSSPDVHSKTLAYMQGLSAALPNSTPTAFKLDKYVNNLVTAGLTYDPFASLVSNSSVLIDLQTSWLQDKKDASAATAWINWRIENSNWARKEALLKLLGNQLLFAPSSFASMIKNAFDKAESSGIDRSMMVKGRIFSFGAHLPLAQAVDFTPRGWRQSWPSRSLTSAEIKNLDFALAEIYGVKLIALKKMIKAEKFDEGDIEHEDDSENVV